MKDSEGAAQEHLRQVGRDRPHAAGHARSFRQAFRHVMRVLLVDAVSLIASPILAVTTVLYRRAYQREASLRRRWERAVGQHAVGQRG